MCLFENSSLIICYTNISKFQKIDELKNASGEFLTHVNGLAPPPVMMRYSVKESGKQGPIDELSPLKFDKFYYCSCCIIF